MSISEFITWTKHNDRRDHLHLLQDKIELKNNLKEMNISEYVDAEYISSGSFDINTLSNLPPEYVIKMNHGCGWNIFYKNNQFKLLKVVDFINPSSDYTYKCIQTGEVNQIVKDWLQRVYSTDEWVYTQISPRVFIEPLIDIKYEVFAYCVNGKVRMFRTLLNEHSRQRTSHYYDENWESLHSKLHVTEQIHSNFIKPFYINRLHEICEKITSRFEMKFLRIDFFVDNEERIYVSECTLYPQGGWKNPTYDSYLGKYLVDNNPGYYNYIMKNIDDYYVYANNKKKRSYRQPIDILLTQVFAHIHEPGLTFIDIGANVGQFCNAIMQLWGHQTYVDTLHMWEYHNMPLDKSRHSGDLGMCDTEPIIHAFEPNPDIFKHLMDLKTRRYKYGENFIINEIGVSDSIGELTLYDCFTNGPGNGHCGFCKYGNAITTVPTITLDHYIVQNNITNIAFLKIDVEGFEKEVIFGMENAISRNIVNLFTFEYGSKWSSKFRPNDPVALHEMVSHLYKRDFHTFIFGYTYWVPIYDKYWDPRYENTNIFESIELISIHKNHPKYKQFMSFVLL